MNRKLQSVGKIFLVIFFATGAVFSCVVLLALAFPHREFDSIWRLKPEAQTHFQALGKSTSIALMAAVGAACGFAAAGLARNAEWGRRLAIGVLTINLIGDSLNALFVRDPRTLIGLPIGAVMILFLVRAKRTAR